ncbi:MAG: hypothetical protein H6978_02270 [Gammaproteobacteria bacterium]|nr:hypothetical protein [Gammaproteobacteria bacterium]
MISFRPRSLQTRLVVSATISLALLLGLAGWVLDQLFRDTVERADYDRLRSQIYMLLGAVEEDAGTGALSLPAVLPDPRLLAPASGLYAQMADSSGKVIWRSQSMLGLAIPPPHSPDVGDFDRNQLDLGAETSLRALSYSVLWELPSGAEQRYTVQVSEDLTTYGRQVRRFRRSLLRWFGGVVLVLLIVQSAILRWGLSPIRDVAAEINLIEEGEQDRISGNYPKELHVLTNSLNALLEASQIRLTRYRNALGDLAHSLKTPLAVLRNTVDMDISDRVVIHEQLDQLDNNVDYHLKKAAAVGGGVLMQSVEVADILERLASSLRKVYVTRDLDIKLSVTPGMRFFGDQGDLYEIAGNVMDNACKWARRRVIIEARTGTGGRGRPPFQLTVRDDGPGIPADAIDAVLERGTRADQRAPGHGIGLAVVRELVENVYRGQLRIDSSPAGTTVKISIRFN